MSIALKYLRKSPFSIGKGRIGKMIKIPEGEIDYVNGLGVKYHLHLDQYLMKNIYLYDIPESNTHRQITRYLSKLKGPLTILDCGANIGLYSLNLAKLFPSSKIHAFEPLQFNFEIFEQNIQSNNFDNIKANKLGIGDKPGEFEIMFGNKKSGASLYVDDYNQMGKETIQIVTIDDYCAEKGIDSINFLKIDVEGGEFKVLEGAKSILEKSENCLAVIEIIEKHLQAAGDSGKKIFEIMKDLGFTPYLPKSWPFDLKKISGHQDLPETYTDNVFFIK